ncbi:MAG: shikimate dehydrogenase [Pseudomonadota bacterium]|nr:shikimate dehydrogenase [Pseudomonadota bacterium]
MTQYAVMGDPISHSKSPQIHSLFAEQSGEDMHYDKFQIAAADFPAEVAGFFDRGGGGLNVTVPHKEAAFALADCPRPRASLARAANTLGRDRQGGIWADNTDGVGLVRDLTDNHQLSLSGMHILMLGAGGAARGVLAELLHCAPASITIMNRTLSRAEELRTDLAAQGLMHVRAMNEPGGPRYDLVINGTSASLKNEGLQLDTALFAASFVAYDMVYGAKETVFMSWAKAAGAGAALDGLGMLVEQAAESFALWRGKRPETQRVIDQIRQSL